MIEIYCDGACSGNPGPGAWAYIAYKDGVPFAHASGVDDDTTNNRMELLAAIKALEAFSDCKLILDSKYVLLGITQWQKKWIANGWKSASGDVKNVDLWKQLIKLNSQKIIDWSWQKGHNNNIHDAVDALARSSVLI